MSKCLEVTITNSKKSNYGSKRPGAKGDAKYHIEN